jgi:UDP-GlcNAc:undecaprenyl-phosphate GlcNAc-1-phosphate transferase
MFHSLNLVSIAVVAFVGAFALSGGLVALTIRICRAHGWVAKPRSDRWHRSAPSLFGGVPIWLTCVGLSVIFLPLSNHVAWKLIGASTLMFLLGFVDDIWHLRPRSKLIVQIFAAGLIVTGGVTYPLFHNVSLNMVVSLLWIVGITNAFNLLDNMDGLAAGVALISALYLAFFYLGSGSRENAILVVLTAGALGGFLLFNLNPARIFMGDCGSLFIGFLLGTTSQLEVTHVVGVPAFAFAPAVVLAIPIFDTFFVSVTRRLRGQAASQGGTDHSSHRLVQLGLNERHAVSLLFALSIGSGLVALAVRHVLYPHALGLIGFWFLFLFLFGIHLFRPETPVPSSLDHGTTSLLNRILVRDALVFLLDPVALSFSYYLAYFLRFRTSVPNSDLELFLRSLPIVLGVKFICLWVCRVYKRSWWRGSIGDFHRVGQATLIGEVASVLLIIGLFRFQGFSRVVFILDGVFSWTLLVAIRKSFSLFRESLGRWRPAHPGKRRVFVLGTSEGAELALRFLRDRRIECAGLIDTNGGSDLGRWVWGTQVVGGLNDLTALGNCHGVRELILPENESIPYSEVDFRLFCQRAHLHLIKLGLYSAEPTPGAIRRDEP